MARLIERRLRRRDGRTFGIAGLVLLAVGVSRGTAQVFDDRGFNRNRDFFSQLPFEHIDPLTGNLLLSHTDLALPGNGGFDLRIQRTYNSKIYRNYGLPGQALDEDSWAGVGWTLHLGRVFNVLGTDTASPVIEMPDGSRHPTFHKVGSPDYVSRDHWLYNKNTFTLRLPSGVVYTFGRTTTIAGASVAYATQIRDPFGNTITISYLGSPVDAIDSITQDLGGGQQRTVTFVTVSGELREMRYAGRTWLYTHLPTSAASFSRLMEARPPVGQSWRYEYQSVIEPKWELRQVTTPSGGQINYTYAEFQSRLGDAVIRRFHGVATRDTAGRDVAPGHWTYSYAQGAGRNETTITGPCSAATERFLGVGNTTAGAVWRIGLLDQRTVSEGGTTLQTEQLAWRTPAFGDRISDDDQQVGNNRDTEIYVPLVESRTVTRNGRTYTSTNSYHTTDFNDYGRPWQILEEGDSPDRTTTRTFDYDFGTLYIKDRIGSETVSVVGSGSFATAYEYDDATGFLTAEVVHGIRKEYTAVPPGSGGAGSRASVRDMGTESGAQTTNLRNYFWSQARTIETPEYAITRVINPEGTVQSETRRGLTTGFLYDDLFRPTRTTPPSGGGNPTITAYDTTGDMESFTLTRGSSTARTDLDGFGRPSGTENSEGVKTDVRYDACGRRQYESYPYLGTANIGTTYTYDGLDRIKRKQNPELTPTAAIYAYAGSTADGGINVTITNERDKVTVQTWRAVGDPGQGRLEKVRDANSNSWSYQYNTVGSLTSVDAPAGPLREWTYYTAAEAPNGYGLLKSESHPENEGQLITYAYHPNGLLRTRTDPRFGANVHHYDRNNRLTSLDRPGTAYDTGMSYDDSDNRRTLGNGYASSTFGYDNGNRLTSRTDVIAGRTFTTGYTPDGNDNVQRIDYHSGLSVTYDYDTANRVVAVRRTGTACPGGAGCFARLVSYHPSGGVASFVAGNGGTHTVGYDPRRYWVTSINAGGHLVLGYVNYDGVGNVGDITESTPDPGRGAAFNQHFVYDNLDRLTTANGPWGPGSFGYDDLGNRRTKTVGSGTGSITTYTYNPSTLRLDSATGSPEADSFLYDTNGNLTSQNGRTYTYTPENMVETATVGGVPSTYRYDGDSLRKVKEVGGAKRYFLHGLGSQLLSEYEEPCPASAPQRVKDYVYLGSRLLAAVRPAVTPVSVSFTVAAASPAESATSATAAVRLLTGGGAATICPVAATITPSAGTATAGADFDPAPRALTFPAGTASGTVQNVSLGILSDALDEDDETYSLALSAAGAEVGTPGSLAVTIVDDDPTPAVTSVDQSITEGDTGTRQIVFPVRLSAASGRNVTVGFATRNGTATAPADYVAVSQTLLFAPGTTEIPVPVTVQSDVLDEEDSDTFFVDVTPVLSVTGGGAWRGTILDDDPLPEVRTFDNFLTEGDSEFQDLMYPVTLNVPSGREVRVDFATADNTASAGADYATRGRTLVFPAGTTVVSEAVPVFGERVYEPGAPETFFVKLENPRNAVPAAPPRPGGWQGEITDNDPAPTVSVSDCSVVETPDTQNSVPCRFTVTLSNPSFEAVTVDFATAAAPPPSAQPGPDYEATSGTLTFDAGTSQLAWARPVLVFADLLDEGNESFLLRLSNLAGGGATLANGEGVGTIIDNEAGRFHTVAACRLLDTRVSGGALQSGTERSFAVNTGSAGCPAVPPGAKAVALNVTVVQPSEAGSLRVFPRGLSLPATSVINFSAGKARANNATVLVGAREHVTVRNDMASTTGTTHVVVDVFGYYR